MVSAIDSELFRDKYGTTKMRKVFSAQNTLQQWLNVEAALAEAEAEVGLVPVGAAKYIRSHAKAELIPLKTLRAKYAVVGYPILPLLQVWEQHLGEEAARWVHWGATTQDITDTGLVLQISQAIRFLERDLASLCDLLRPLALRHRDTVMAGRTHGQHAVPITFGFKVSIWLAELYRHSTRLQELRPRALMGQLSGASGTLAALEDKGIAVQEIMMRRLGLSVPPISWHTSRDAFAEFACWLAILGSTLERIAHEIELLQKTEIGELAEPYEPEKGASSTMPQKRNPATCEAIIALGKLLRSEVPVVMASMTQEHERDWWGIHIEWKALPEMCVLCSGALDLTLHVIKGLQVYPDKMSQNLATSSGLIMAEAVMMRLSPILGRSVAHKVIYEASMRATEQGCSLREILEQDAIVTAALSPEDFEQLMNPAGYLGHTALWVERIVTQS